MFVLHVAPFAWGEYDRWAHSHRSHRQVNVWNLSQLRRPPPGALLASVTNFSLLIPSN